MHKLFTLNGEDDVRHGYTRYYIVITRGRSKCIQDMFLTLHLTDGHKNRTSHGCMGYTTSQ